MIKNFSVYSFLFLISAAQSTCLGVNGKEGIDPLSIPNSKGREIPQEQAPQKEPSPSSTPRGQALSSPHERQIMAGLQNNVLPPSKIAKLTGADSSAQTLSPRSTDEGKKSKISPSSMSPKPFSFMDELTEKLQRRNEGDATATKEITHN